MRPWIPLLLCTGLALAGIPLATAEELGELVSDAPVALLGSGSLTGGGIVVHHDAFRDGSLSGVVSAGRLFDTSALRVKPGQPSDCQSFDGHTEEKLLATANATAPPWRTIKTSLHRGAFARLELATDLHFSIGSSASDTTKEFATTGPNPYRYQTQQQAASGNPPANLAPAFYDGAFVTVPTSAFVTTDAHTLLVYWGDLETAQDSQTTTYSAGPRDETRTAPAPFPPLTPPATCELTAFHTLRFETDIGTVSIDQQGADRPLTYWRGEGLQPAFASNAGNPPTGQWDRARGADYSGAREKLQLPATVAGSPDLHMLVVGAARFDHAVGGLTANGHIIEAKDSTVKLQGTIDLVPRGATGDGRRMTTRVAGDPALVDLAAAPRDGRSPAAAWMLGTAALGGMAGIGAGAFFWPRLKFTATRFALLPLYARLKKEDILENPIRDDILEVVESAPGISASELGRRLTCGWGTLVYHLTVLERMQLLSSAREGRHKRFFVQGRINYSDKAAVGLLANAASRLILDAVQANPGLIQRDLGQRLGLTAGTVAWHVERLEAAGLVVREAEGRVVRYYPSSKLVDLTKQLAA